MLTAYKKFWQHYVDFTGRSTRSEFWYAMLANFLIEFVLLIFGIIVFIVLLSASFQGSSLPDVSEIISNIGAVFGSFILSFFPFGIFLLATFIPQLAIIVRRLRDAGFHWAFVFLGYGPSFLSRISDTVAILYWPCLIALIVLLCQPTKYEAGQVNFAPNQGGQPQPFEQNNQNFNQPSQSFSQGQPVQSVNQQVQNVSQQASQSFIQPQQVQNNQEPVNQGEYMNQQTNQSFEQNQQPSDQAIQNGQTQTTTPTQAVENVQSAEPFGQAFSQAEESPTPQTDETNEAPTGEE